MPALQNDRHEKFVQAIIAKNLSATAAYRSVYGEEKSDRTATSASSRLMTYVSITDRLRELRERNAAKHEITIDRMIERFEKAAEAAENDKQHGAVVSALTAQAKLAGLWVERAENLNGNYAISDAPLSEEEWLARHVK